MSVTFPWLVELSRLDSVIASQPEEPVDLNDLDFLEKLANAQNPVDVAGVRGDAEALMREILSTFERGSDEDRKAIRDLVEKFKSFFWAVAPPAGRTSAETLRSELVHFALIDQYPDPRDAVLELQKLSEWPGVSLQTLAALRSEVAPMASDEDRYEFGSTRSMLLRGYSSHYGQRGAPVRSG